MTDEHRPEESERPEERMSGWGVLGGVLIAVVLSPFALAAGVNLDYAGAIGVLVLVGVGVFALLRSGRRSLAFGIVLGYVLLTVASGGICTGWNQAIL